MYKVGISSNIEDYFSGAYHDFEFETLEEAETFANDIMNMPDDELKQYCFSLDTEGINWYFPSCDSSGNLGTDSEDDKIECYMLIYVLSALEENEGYKTRSWIRGYCRRYILSKVKGAVWYQHWCGVD